MSHSVEKQTHQYGQILTSKRGAGYGSSSSSGSKKPKIDDPVDDSEPQSNVFSLASRFPSSGSDQKRVRIEPVPRAYPLPRSSNADYFVHSEAMRAKYTAIYVNEEQTNRDVSIDALPFDFLLWLLEDYENPDQFAKKLAITQGLFASLFKNNGNRKLLVEFAENIAIAIQRIENSKDFQSKWRNVFTAERIENFITFQLVKLFLANQLSSETIDLLDACNVFQQNTMFRTFMRVVVHAAETVKGARDAGADLSQVKPSSSAIPRTHDAWKTLMKRRTRYEQTYLREEQKPTEADSTNMTHHFLFWLLEDFEEPDVFASKLAITPDALPNRLKVFRLPLPYDFVENIAIAIWRLENSKNYISEWHDKLYERMEPFVTNHIARLLIKSQLSPGAIRKLKGCRLIRENQHFRRLIGLPPLVIEASGDSLAGGSRIC